MPIMFDQILAGVREGIAAREAQVSFRDIKAMSTAVPPPRDALGALLQFGCSVIAEIGRTKPARRARSSMFSPRDLAQKFEAGGARIIGCPTDSPCTACSRGSLQKLHEVKSAVAVPVMCKDFIIDPYQVHEARYYGADMVPLLASVLDQCQMMALVDRIESLGMTALVEVHTADEASRAIQAGARVVGVSARTPFTAATSLDVFSDIAPGLPTGTVRIALSGVRTVSELMQYAGAGADAVIVGDDVAATADPQAACRKLVAAGQHPACPSVN